jgi:quinol monooxygenase YgiN
MTTISPEQNVATLINVFTVAPENQERLIELLDRATEEVMRHLAGFVSANLHKSLDGTHVVNYAQWESRAAFEAMLANTEAQRHMAAALTMAQSEPHLYEVARVAERG